MLRCNFIYQTLVLDGYTITIQLKVQLHNFQRREILEKENMLVLLEGYRFFQMDVQKENNHTE